MDFRERALHEARRYGDDPFVFVRELIQNARDADARAAHFRVETGSGRSRVVCRDDGDGMSLEHARRYLFTLYASSKRERRDAGRFGVGFWSVLRFEPDRVVVRSWPRRGAAWEIALAGDLSSAALAEPPACPFAAGHGTEVLLDRAGEDTELRRRVRDAAIQSSRFVTRRREPATPLDLRVDGERVTAPFALARPSACFRRRGLRGVVALGREARVELFARGLRVRSAATLGDLRGGSGASRVLFPESEGLVPQALLDGDALAPLLARSDVKDDPALRRLLRVAEAELARLVDRQLALARPEPRGRRAALATAVLGILGLAAVLGRVASPARAPDAPGPVRPAAPPAVDLLAGPVAGTRVSAPVRLRIEPFRDPGAGYAGPQASPVDAEPRVPILRYTPSSARPLLAVVRMEDARRPPPALEAVGPYAGAPCAGGCLELELLVEGEAGPVRLPRATGHVLDGSSVRVDGRPARLARSALGEPLLVLATPGRVRVRYRSGPGPEEDSGAVRPPPEDPVVLHATAALLRQAPADERADAGAAWVRDAVRYSTTAGVVDRHRAAAAAGEDVIARALRLGAGDCDVQGAVLATLLQHAGLRARLVVGHVGEAGGVLPVLHAWVEWRDSGGRWQAADAGGESAPAPPSPGTPAAGAATVFRPPAVPPVTSRLRPWAPASLAAAVLGALALVVLRRHDRRLELDPAHDVAQLLQGALARPEAFRAVPAVFERPLVPVWPRGFVPLGAAWDDAARRRLYASERRSGLAAATARAGGRVVDTSREAGRRVADALGAVDLDAWDALLARGRSSAVLRGVERAFGEAGEPLTLRAVAGLGPSAVLDLPRGRWRRGTRRHVVVDADALGLASAGEATFALAARVAALLKLDPRRAARVLGPLAARALLERR